MTKGSNYINYGVTLSHNQIKNLKIASDKNLKKKAEKFSFTCRRIEKGPYAGKLQIWMVITLTINA